jgi:predicted nucleic acid-binding protein
MAQKLGKGINEMLGTPISCHFFYSVQTRKEINNKKGISSSERQKYNKLLATMTEIRLDVRIGSAAGELLQKYALYGLHDNRDAVIAATAFIMNLPLVTYNLRHFRFIDEIRVIYPLDLMIK